MPKTKRYFIGITTYNTSFVEMEVTKQQYEKMKKHYVSELKQNHANNTEEDSEYYVYGKETTKETEQLIVREFEINDGSTYVSFCMKECRDGYHFKTKKERAKK